MSSLKCISSAIQSHPSHPSNPSPRNTDELDKLSRITHDSQYGGGWAGGWAPSDFQISQSRGRCGGVMVVDTGAHDTWSLLSERHNVYKNLGIAQENDLAGCGFMGDRGTIVMQCGLG